MNLPEIVAGASVAMAILAAPAVLIKCKYRGRKAALDDIFLGASAASAVPTGIALLYAAFVPEIIPTLRGLNVHIAAAGLALLFISIKKLID